MRIVDSHCHVGASWYEPIETLLAHMDRNHVAQAVLIQMLGQFDNRYQQAYRHLLRDRLASVVAVDSSLDTAISELKRLAESGASGVRLRPTARSPGDDPLVLWRTAEQLGLAVSCVGTSATFAAAEFREVIEAVPALKIVLEHLGGSNRPDATDAEREQRAQVFELARYPNVYLKVPGLGELLARPASLAGDGNPWGEALPPVLEAALRSFGAERLMWGSDFPVVSSREGYANSLAWSRGVFSGEADQVLQAIFGDTARTVFALPR